MTLYKIIDLKILLVFFSMANLSLSNAQTKYEILIDSAEVSEKQMRYQSSLMFLEEALQISRQTKKSKQIIHNLLKIGEAHIFLDDMNNAIENFLNALRLSETIQGDDSLQFQTLLKISYCFLEFEILESAEAYLNQAKTIADQNNLSEYYRDYYGSLGILERRKKNYELSIKAYQKSLELSNDEIGIQKVVCLNNLATAYIFAGDPKTAQVYLYKAQTLNNSSIKNEYWEVGLIGQIGKTHQLLGNPKEAIKYYQLALKKSKTGENRDIIRRVNRELARTHYKLGNYKTAYDYYATFVKERENSHSREGALAIAEMSAKYEHEKNEQKIQNLEEQHILKTKIHESRMERRNLWILVAVLVLVVTIIIAILVFKNQRNKQRLKLELIENQKEIAKQQAEMRGQENEKNRLSRELHDGLGGTLASIKMRLSSINVDAVTPILSDIDAACQDVRNMSHSLSSTFIEEVDFYSLLKKLSNDIEWRSALRVHLEFMPLEELNQLGSKLKHQCFRIIQELTNNTIKHAQASTLTIGLVKNEGNISLLIEDDGIGFKTDAQPTGIGLINVRNRLKDINGALDIKSTINQGTTILINFPNA